MKTFILTFFLAGLNLPLMAQQIRAYNLALLLKEDELVTTPAQETKIIDSAQKQGISTKGIVWLKNINLANGTIDVDLKGKNVFLQSFLGVAFHASDTSTYDVVYFRPFRFRSTDTPTRKWSVQYMSLPGYDYVRLRKEHPLVYENAVNPVPDGDDWFHATIVIKDDWITVYVNHSAKPSLTFKKLNDHDSGMIGLWTSASSGEFANLAVRDEE